MRLRFFGLLLILCVLMRSGLWAFQSPDFALAASPGSQAVWQAHSDSYLLTVSASGGFTGTVGFSASGLPSGATVSFSPTSVSGSGTTVATVSASAGTAIGSSTVTFTATSGALVHTTPVTLNIVVPPVIGYAYDAAGRLASVTDSYGNSAIYSYDLVGNLLSISRQTPSQVTLSAFSPSSGLVGTTVTILGSGFSPTLIQNVVQFNGVAATVISATNGLIRVTVPPTATTGTISIAVSGGTPVISATSFTVGSTPGAPTITSFTPTIGTYTVPINISGTNFSTSTMNDTVKLAATALGVQSATTTLLSAPLPSTSGSGHISVQTPYGLATTASDFFFVPAPYTEADVLLATRAVTDTPISVTFSATQTVALVLFEGTQGQVARLLTNTSQQSQVISIYNPDGTVLASNISILGNGGGVIDTPVFPSTGTYTALIKADSYYLGSLNLTVTSAASSGDFQLTAIKDFYHNNPLGPAFQVIVNAGSGLTPAVTFSTSGLPSCVTPVFYPTSVGASSASQLTFTLSGCTAGSYSFSVTGTSGANSHSVSLTLDLDLLPSGWSESDIGGISPGAAFFSSGTYTVHSFGFDDDAFSGAFETLSGDGSIVARVTSLYNLASFSAQQMAYGGVLIRESLTSGSNGMYLRLSNLSGAKLQWRTTTNGPLNSASFPTLTAPYWVKITRDGNTLSAFASSDGASWVAIGSPTTISMASSVYIGLAAGASSFGRIAEATFDNVAITSAPDFSMGNTSSAQTVLPSATASYSVSVGTFAGYSGTVSFSASGLPSGASATFSPSSITGGGSTSVSIATSSSTPLGTYSVTISGTDGTLTRLTRVTLIVGAPDFDIALAPTTQTAQVSTSTTYTVTVASISGFAGTVTLGATGIPPGATVSFSPSSITASGTSTATITLGANTPPLSYPITFIGSSGGSIRTANGTLNAALADFTVSIDTNWMTFPGSGGSATRNITVAAFNGFAKTITLSAVNLPPGVTATFSPATISTSGTSVLTITTPTGLPAALTVANVVGTAIDSLLGNPTHSIPVSLITYASGTLPSGWTNVDIGSVNIPGAAGFANNIFTIQGSGIGEQGTADHFNFTYQSLSGDGEIVARISGLQNTRFYTSIGVMMRESLDPDSATASTLVEPSTSPSEFLQTRSSNGGTLNTIAQVGIPAATWMKLSRVGDTFTTSWSSDGVVWTSIGSSSVVMGTDIFVGLAISSNDDSTLTTGSVDSVAVVGASADYGLAVNPANRSVAAGGLAYYRVDVNQFNSYSNTISLTASGLPTGTTATFSATSTADSSILKLVTDVTTPVGSYILAVTGTDGTITHSNAIYLTVGPASISLVPAPWATEDVGAVGIAGTVSFSDPVFTVGGSGSSIYGSSDQFRYVYQSLTGDGVILARVQDVQNYFGSSKTGVMIRESLAPEAKEAFVTIEGNTSAEFQYRASVGGTTSLTSGPSVSAPSWVKLVRAGNLFSAYSSSDGTTWSQIGSSTTVAMTTSVFVGLAVSAETNSAITTGVFDTVVTGGSADFYLTATSSSATVNPINGFSGTVDLAVSNLPAGATASFSPTSISGSGTSTLAIVPAPGTASGNYPVVVSGTSGGVTRTSSVTLVVNTSAAPTFSPAAGSYSSIQTITLSSLTTGASLRYTTDGSAPSSSSGTVYTGPITVPSTETVKAISYKSGLVDSSVTSAAYALSVTAVPTFSVSSGVYGSAQTVTITTGTSGASIRYTVDGTTPTSSVGTPYSGALTIGSTTTVRAIAFKSSFTDSAVAAATYTIGAGPAWTDTAWSRRTAIHLDHTKVSGSSALTNFALLISLTDPKFKTVANGGNMAKSDATDLLFTGVDGVTKLDHELESYNPTTGAVVAWVRIPSLSNSSDTTVYAYYGNASATDQQNKTGVWDSTFAMVQHLPDGTTLSANDSTSNGCNSSALDSTAPTQGEIAGGASFNGSSNSIPFNSCGAANNLTAQTISLWANAQLGMGSYSRLIEKGGNNEWTLLWNYGSPNKLSVAELGGSGLLLTSTNSIADNTWHKIDVTISSGYYTKLYVDGVLDTGAQSPSSPGSPTGTIRLGAYGGGGTSFYHGLADELRISNVARSSDWIATEYANESLPMSFMSLGDSEGTGGLVASVPTFSPGSGISASTQSVTISSATSGATIRYTIDGTTPTPSTGTIYSAPVSISSSATIRAIAYKSGMTGSLVTLSTYVINGWYNASWTTRKAVVVDHAKVSGSSALVDFPLLVSVTDATLKTTANGGDVGKSDGTDLVFTAADGTTKLDHEIESYDATTGQVIAWVRVPSLSYSSDTTIFMYYGYGSASDQQNKTGVWDSNYLGVYHMSAPGGTLSVDDSTSNARNLTKSSDTPITGTGQIGGAMDSSTSGHMGGASKSDFGSTGFPVTFSVWFNTPGDGSFVVSNTNSNNGIRIERYGGQLYYTLGGVNAYVFGALPTIATNTNYFLSITVDSPGTTATAYLGTAGSLASQSISVSSSINGTPTYLTLGESQFDPSPGGRLAGKLDEARISGTARSADWISTEYKNQNAPSSFTSLGAIENAP